MEQDGGFRPGRQGLRRRLVEVLAWTDGLHARWRRRDEEMWDKFLSWPLGVRDLLAVLTVMLAVACVVVPALLGGADFKRSGELVHTQPRESAKLIEVDHLVRGRETYYVHLAGEDVEMDYGWFIPNPTPGMTIEVVRDPENSSRIIAVGTPQDWADRPWLNAILAALALVLGLVAALFAGIKLVPERAEPALEGLAQRGNRFARWLDETLQTWPGRDSPPSGRHS